MELYSSVEEGVFRCLVCPHSCVLRSGVSGLCRVRRAGAEGIQSLVYGEPVAVHVDPVEKKPLNHYYPGEPVFSIGTLGCNLRCRGCQNDGLSRVEYRTSGERVSPEQVVSAAERAGCRMIAYTYNEPIVWAEYARDIAEEVHRRGMRNILVSAGFMQERALEWFLEPFDAANIDLKGFSEEFYRSWAGGRLADVLRSIEIMHRRPGFWLELTTLVVPGINDSEEMLDREFAWIVEHLGVDVPLHLSAFHPACEATDISPTPVATLVRAAEQARRHGIHFVYVGNVRLETSTDCPHCGGTLIHRAGFHTKNIALDGGKCRFCGAEIPGVWGDP